MFWLRSVRDAVREDDNMKKLWLVALGVFSFGAMFWYMLSRHRRRPWQDPSHRPHPYTTGEPRWD